MALYEALPTVPSHGDPLIITLLLGGCLQPHLLVDEGSAVNILFKCTIEDLKVEDHFAPPAFPMVRFGNNRIMPLGVIELPVSFIDRDKIVNIAANFLIVDKQATFDGIIGRLLTHTINVLPSSCHRIMFFKITTRAGVIYGNQMVGRELMHMEYNRLTSRTPPRPKKYNSKCKADAAINFLSVEALPQFTPNIKPREVPLFEGSERNVCVGGNLITKEEVQLLTLLQKWVDVFAWDVNDLTCDES